jgi:ribosomal protein S1
MSWSKSEESCEGRLAGDTVEAIVSDVNRDSSASLSLKDTLPDPWGERARQVQGGRFRRGKVRNLTDFGAFVEIEEGVDGLCASFPTCPGRGGSSIRRRS